MKFPSLVAVAVTVFAVPLHAFQGDDETRLEKAAEELEKGGELIVRGGAQMCAEINSPESAELMLSVLRETLTRGTGYLPAPHYRDVVWEGLIELTDPYARAHIAKEIKSNKDDPFVRQWCAELLGIYGDDEFGDELQRALSDKHAGVRQAAARSLGLLEYTPAIKALKKQLKHKVPYVRANAFEALARIDAAEWGEAFCEAIGSDKDGGARCALLAAIPEVLPDRNEELALAGIEDEDWRVRLQAVDNLGSIKTKASIDALVKATEDERPVVQVQSIKMLKELTGQKHSAAKTWKAWWKDNREKFAFPEGRSKAAPDERRSVATYNGVRVVSDNVAFLIDKSQAMAEPLTSRGMSKEEAAREELEQVLSKLHDQMTFNVYTYEREYEAFSKKPVELNKSSQKKALAFEEKKNPQDSKDVWAVLEHVIQDPMIDTVYMLSSGEPDIGLYVHSNRLTAHLKDLNRFHKVVVHTIAYSDREFYRDQMKAIADATGGEFSWFE